MNDIRVRQGSRVQLQITQGDPLSTSVQLFLRGQVNFLAFDYTAEFVEGVADLSFTAPTEIDVYDMQVNELFAEEDPIKYPDPDCEDCSFPTLTVCDALDVAEES